ncbi:MAG: amino acid ABC transporter permease [Clostridiales bacterium]|nr:amino acid ABC transporter permease [Clostridiales bacterium]
MSQEAIWKLFKLMLDASAMTGKLFFFTLLIGLPLGLLLALGRMSRIWVISYPIRFFLLVMRGTPLILQLFFFYFGPYYLFGATMQRVTAAIVGMGLNYAAYFAEIYRSGIQSMPRGQYEAATVLGFTRRQTFFKIILPQVIKRILPPMGNEFMTLVKDTALVNCIGVGEIYLLAKDTMSTEGSIIPLLMAGAFYLIMNSIVSRCMSITEKKLDYYR